ncbi:MAG: nickel-dependent hydrogenase large subunit [Granulosicoccaceae bacterium]
MSSTRRILGPFNRVEGDLEVRIESDESGQRVERAWVNSPLFRGFEQMLKGRAAEDALAITPRICGICSVAQSVAAARALGAAQGIETTPNGLLASNLVLATENLADHLSHFYLFFMPDFARAHYSEHTWHKTIQARFKAQTGAAMPEVLQARAEWLHITGLLAGKWPHSLAIQPGGTTRSIDRGERSKLEQHIRRFQLFLKRVVFGGAELEQVTALGSKQQLEQLVEQFPDGDLARFCRLADALDLYALGSSLATPMSFGAYAQTDGQPLFAQGLSEAGAQGLEAADIREDISHAWMSDEQTARHPSEGVTQPAYAEGEAYSWCKAPRMAGSVIEVGALARQRVDGHPLFVDLVQQQGSNVFSRELARLIELARVSQAMLRWASEIQPQDPFINHGKAAANGEGAGLVEAARGSLGHWVRLEAGKIVNYQIIAPTTWNFSPRDASGQPGALEQALVGAPLAADTDSSVAVQHIIRSYDPCMVCTVH